MKSLPWILPFLTAVVSIACDTDGGEKDYSDAPLPAAYSASGGICDGPATAPSFEVWAASADAIVFGTVTKVEPLFEPAAVASRHASVSTGTWPACELATLAPQVPAGIPR